MTLHRDRETDTPSRVVIARVDYDDPSVTQLLAPPGGFEQFIDPNSRAILTINLLSGEDRSAAVTALPSVVRAVASAVRDAGGKPVIADPPAGRFSRRKLKKAYERSALTALAEEEDIALNHHTSSRWTLRSARWSGSSPSAPHS